MNLAFGCGLNAIPFNELRFQVGESVPDSQFRAESSILRLGETELRVRRDGATCSDSRMIYFVGFATDCFPTAA